MAITAFLSRSPVLLNRGPGGPASLEHVPHSSIFSPTNWTSCAPSCIIIWRPLFFLRASKLGLNSTSLRSRLYPDIPRPDAPVIYTGAFPFLTAWPESICYIQTDSNLILCIGIPYRINVLLTSICLPSYLLLLYISYFSLCWSLAVITPILYQKSILKEGIAVKHVNCFNKINTLQSLSILIDAYQIL